MRMVLAASILLSICSNGDDGPCHYGYSLSDGNACIPGGHQLVDTDEDEPGMQPYCSLVEHPNARSVPPCEEADPPCWFFVDDPELCGSGDRYSFWIMEDDGSTTVPRLVSCLVDPCWP
jgi:hypothetical protein